MINEKIGNQWTKIFPYILKTHIQKNKNNFLKKEAKSISKIFMIVNSIDDIFLIIFLKIFY